jgi:hypothetical protein
MGICLNLRELLLPRVGLSRKRFAFSYTRLIQNKVAAKSPLAKKEPA